MKREVRRLKVDTRGELLARFWDAAVYVNKHECQPRLTTRGFRTRFGIFTEFVGGNFEHLLCSLTDQSFEH
jgi:hypothetical protein